jgi:ADP-ribose pyrophosphatase YjhB (NUDIX family)
VGVIVEDEEGRVLLARRAIDPYRGMWDTPGGYLEEGEHPVDGIHRELLEETGLTVEPGEFLGAFMDWYGDAPDANATLNLFWTASVVSGDPVPADDVAELRWFAAHEVPADEEFAFTVLPSVLDAWRSR